MALDFNEIKIGFKAYLDKLAQTNGKEYDVENLDVSIFLYSTEFKEYLKTVDEVSIDGQSIDIDDALLTSLSDFANLLDEIEDEESDKLFDDEVEDDTDSEQTDVPTPTPSVDLSNGVTVDENGMIVEEGLLFDSSAAPSATTPTESTETSIAPETTNVSSEFVYFDENGMIIGEDYIVGNTTEAEPTTSSGENGGDDNTEAGDDDDSFIKSMLNSMFAIDSVKKAADKDGDGEISEDELDIFMKSLGVLDGDDSNLSLDDLLLGYEKIEKDEFELIDEEAEEEVEEPEDTETVEQPAATPGTSGSGGGGTIYTPTTSTSPSPSVSTVDYSSMTNEQLRTELATNQQSYEQQAALARAAILGDSATIPDLVAFDTAIEQSEKAYLDLFEDETVKNQIQEKQTAIDGYTQNVQMLEFNIIDLDLKIENYGAQITTLEADVSRIQSLINGLDSTAENYSSQKSALQTQLNAYQNQLSTAQSNKAQAEQTRADYESQKAEAEANLATAQGEFDTLIQQLNENNEAAAVAYEAWQAAIAQKQQAVEEFAANQAALMFQYMANITAIEAQMNANLDEEFNKVDKVDENDSADLFTEDTQYSWDFVEGQTTLPYGVITSDKLEEDKAAPLILFLHGDGENGNSSALKSTLYSSIFENYALEQGFNGYVLAPNLPGGEWDTDEMAKNVEQVLDDFCLTHNIDKDNIVLAGFSNGSIGSIYYAGHEIFNGSSAKYTFKSASAISPYSAQGYETSDAVKQIQTELYGYAVTGDNEGALSYLNGTLKPGLGEDAITIMEGASHGSADDKFFTVDSDGDGIADALERAFGLDDEQ
ncbi:hypothetical protein IJ425_03905 [bacterium]|nr:hypothetical protein [bacterium]